MVKIKKYSTKKKGSKYFIPKKIIINQQNKLKQF